MKVLSNSFVKYVLSALLISVINVGIYLVFYNFIIENILVSNCIAYLMSIVVSFFVNKKLVFKSKNKIYKETILFLFVKAIAFIVDSAVLHICFDYLGIPNAISKIIANCSTTISNYSLNKKIVFTSKGKTE